ncbi:hypothetical protein LUZ60_013528 [Juncus effusus]|nr:hypothetical protein LUZ60_013528 [Juncus effusus]
MGKASKRVKRAARSDSEAEFDSEGSFKDAAMEFDSEEDFDSDEDQFASAGGKFASAGDNGESSDGSESDELGEENEGEEEEDEEEEEGEESGSEEEKKEGENRNAEMEQLEKEYHTLRNEEKTLLTTLKRHKDEDALKGQAVKNQKVLWDKALEIRFLLQKAFSNSNKLPKDPIRSEFCNSDEAVDQQYTNLISTCNDILSWMLDLQEAIIEKNPSIAQTTDGNNKVLSDESKGEYDDDWLRLHKMHQRIAPFRNNAVDKWQRKTQVTTGAAALKGKLHAFNQNISDQVAGYMRDPSKMIKRMQLRRSSVEIIGQVQEEEQPDSKKEETDGDGDPELIDDSEFYQQLLKEFLESHDLGASESTFYALRRMQPKKRKIVDRRASKSRKIRYNVHEKIVNFMAPVPMNLPAMAPMLFENLFGRQATG